MMKSTLMSLVAMLGLATAANAQNFMAPATLVSPEGLKVSMVPFSVSVTYDNQVLELINPQTDENGDEYVTAYVKLGEDGEQLPVNTYILYSFGFDGEPDIWELDLALYNLDELFDFTGNKMSVSLPEGIVKNEDGDLNPAQEFKFEIVPTFQNYLETPATGSTLTTDLTVKIDFDGNPIEYFQSDITLYVYEPEYAEIKFKYGKEVTINKENELIIDMSSLANGYYEMTIPEGFVKVDDDGEMKICPSIWLEYTIEKKTDSVEGICFENGENVIYNLQGMKINSVPSKGIFIMNGKKIVK